MRKIVYENGTSKLIQLMMDKINEKEDGDMEELNPEEIFGQSNIPSEPCPIDHWYYSIIEHPNDTHPEPVVCLTKLKSTALSLEDIVIPTTYDIGGVTYLTKLGNATNNPPVLFGRLYINETQYADYNNTTKRIIIQDGVKINNMKNMFENCHSLEYVRFGKTSGTLYPSVSTIEGAFRNCENLKNVIGLGNYSWYEISYGSTLSGIGNLTNLCEAFFGCTSLESIDLTNLSVSGRATNMSRMFAGCSKLKSISVRNRITLSNGNDIMGWRIPSGCTATDMFVGCGTDHVTYVD